MSKKKIKQKFEPGIYNYCDRWCERCKKTEKCFLYSKEQDERLEIIAKGKDPDDPKNAFEMVEKSSSEAHELIIKYCEENDIDPSLSPEEEKEFEKKEKETDPNSDPLAIKSENFRKKLFEWFEATPSLDIIEYHDAYQTLSWHGTLLGTKILRAIRSRNEYLYKKKR